MLGEPPAEPVGPLGGPKRIGLRPGRPFHHLLPVSDGGGDSPHVAGLPHGLSFDGYARVITGRTRAGGAHEVTIRGDGPRGAWTDHLELVVGNEICLTPPLGWNSWSGFGVAVTEGHVREAANILVASGLADLAGV